MGSAPCQDGGATGPPRLARIGCASRHDMGTAAMRGTERASDSAIRFAPSTDGQPGVSGSPGTMKS